MIRWREGRVRERLGGWRGALEYLVDIHLAASGEPNTVKALVYPDLVGTPSVGDLVRLNTTALDAGLGTGGYAFVISTERVPQAAPREPGHIVKARYTPQQVMVLAVDEPDSPHHEALREADDLFGLPVVIADLHSSLPAVVAGAHAQAQASGLGRELRIAYVMTDGAALPLWFSRTVASLRDAGSIIASITAGQSFGGDLEAVTLHSALLAAKVVLDADLVVVTPGPGVAGTGSKWGFSGVAVGEAINAVATLRGRPVAVLRISGADPRARHRGISHHSLTALQRVALAPADVVVPVMDDEHAELNALVAQQAQALEAPSGRHRMVSVETAGLPEALAASVVPLATMGRDLAKDAPAFLAAAAAGRHAVRLLFSD